MADDLDHDYLLFLVFRFNKGQRVLEMIILPIQYLYYFKVTQNR